MSQKILTWAFYILFFLTPLVFTPFNHELFEYNKMMLVYGLTAVITITWVIKMINAKLLMINRTALDIPIVLFLISQVLSTIFSIDPHTSWWGYYSRSNGGLYSIISYLLLYYALVSNFEAKDVLKFLKAAILGGFVVALYAIPEHFGASPSCTLLNLDQGFQLRADCWVQDVQARVFATLGQPNWLGAYLGMLIFPAIYFAMTTKTVLQKTCYLLLITCFYLAFTFTFSRGAMIGFVVGFLVFLSFWLVQNRHVFGMDSRLRGNDSAGKPFLLIISAFILINLLFGSALTGDFKLLKSYAPPRPSLGAAGGGTQLESGGTESGQIRLIVWQGAIDIFKAYPWFGSGVETFAYSYYNFRPVAHNMTSEWDFLYNKAHNEYLNYLATTGAVGLGAYLLLILSFIFWTILRIFNFQFSIFNKNFKFQILNLKTKLTSEQKLLLIAILASYISYLVQDFFGFSVVIIAVFFYTFPGLAIVFGGDTKPLVLPKFVRSFFGAVFRATILRSGLYQKTVSILLMLGLLYVLGTLSRNWTADYLYKTGSDNSDNGEIKQAYLDLTDAVGLNKEEPLYRSELGFAMADVASALKSQDATASSELADEAVRQTEIALQTSPKNVSFWRTAVRTYYQMSLIDRKYVDKSLEALNQSIKLAPTDPKLLYNKGLVLSQNGKVKEGAQALEAAIKLKPNYTEAHFTLSLLYEQLKQKDLALKEMEEVLRIDPTNEDAKKKIEELRK